MPSYCPGCLQEYRAGVALCADCGVPLAATRAEAEEQHDAALLRAAAQPDPDPTAEDADFPEVNIYADTVEVAELLLATLLASQCPAYADPVDSGEPAAFRVAVPVEFAPRASQLLHPLRHRLTSRNTNDGQVVYSRRQKDKVPEQFAVLRLSKREVAAEGERHLAELLRVLADGSDSDVEAAGERILALGTPGIVALLTNLTRHAAEITDISTIHTLSVLAGCRGQPLPPQYRQLVAAAATNPLVRRDLLRVPAVVEDESQLDLLVKHLDDVDVQVRGEAIDALWGLTGETLDYDPEAPAAEREPATRAWRVAVRKG